MGPLTTDPYAYRRPDAVSRNVRSRSLGTSIPKRAAAKGLVEYHLTNFRDYAVDARKTVDDSPFGGGPGMVMMCQTVFDTVEGS